MSTSLFVAQPEFPFSAQLTEKYQPQSVEDFVGLDKVKKIVRNLAANPRPMALMFVGPSGTGW